ncbi:hypothetical protein PIB30_100690 [Stylosanthes scabra]|uniref:Uncharacterized protein n=1 Tax=Stylosanthes scabra TaxID=79078 RepID=A0ABU6WVP0_9FABA|nr:hypothetical protein [Stylosanthes scabra]
MTIDDEEPQRGMTARNDERCPGATRRTTVKSDGIRRGMIEIEDEGVAQAWLRDDIRREREWEATNVTSGAAQEVATTTWGCSGGDGDGFCLRRGRAFFCSGVRSLLEQKQENQSG